MKTFRKRSIVLKFVIFGLLLGVLVLGALEIIVRTFYQVDRIPVQGDYSQGFNVPSTDYGYKPRPNSKVTAIKKSRDGSLIYSVSYTTDEFSRRVTPVKNEQVRNKFLVFFGCSFTFGEGLEDNQTLPYFAGEQAPCYMPYNYGYSGYGPQQMLVRLQNPDFPKQINQHSGVMICSPAHVPRSIGTYYAVTNWAKNFPYFYLDKDGILRRDGDFEIGRPVRSWFYNLFFNIKLADFFLRRYDWPPKYSDSDYAVTSSIIEESFRLFKGYFPDSQIYFMLLPGVDETDQEVARRLKAVGVPILDFSCREEFRTEGYSIAKDGHPTAMWNQQLSRLIVKRLDLSRNDCSD